jgi:hypothetical protein
MSERKNYLKFVDKLDDLSKENELSVQFYADEYPLRMTIRPYTGVGSQMSLLENMEIRGTAPNAVITMKYDTEGVDINVSDRFTITEALLSSYAKAFKSLCQAWFALLYAQIHSDGKVKKEELTVIDNAVRTE